MAPWASNTWSPIPPSAKPVSLSLTTSSSSTAISPARQTGPSTSRPAPSCGGSPPEDRPPAHPVRYACDEAQWLSSLEASFWRYRRDAVDRPCATVTAASLTILYQDAALVVVDKPSGLL